MRSKKELSRFETITLERTMCYGTCPCYVVEIKSDGGVTYHGEHYVEKIGDHSWTIGVDAIEALNETIQKYGYFSIEARVPTDEMTCNPSCITSVRLEDGRFREIDNYYGNDQYPKKLQRLEKRIDEIIGVQEYIGKWD
jgi:hypothetical protein